VVGVARDQEDRMAPHVAVVIFLQLRDIAFLSRGLLQHVETFSLAHQHHQYLCAHPGLLCHLYSEYHAPYLCMSVPDNETPKKVKIVPNLLLY
jgi:hypothetical protein